VPAKLTWPSALGGHHTIRVLLLVVVLAFGTGGLAQAHPPHSYIKACKHGVRCGIACIPRGAVCHKPKL
jgi:hypothetical protein